jgi:hypothetical protein
MATGGGDVTSSRVIDLDWAAWDAGHRGGDGDHWSAATKAAASAKAHDTASATAKRNWLARGNAVSLHKQVVEGRTPSGTTVRGVYDHNIGKVLMKGGLAAEITHVRKAAASAVQGSEIVKGEGAWRLSNGHPLLEILLAKGPASETKGGRASAFKRGLAIAPPSPGAPHGFPVTSPRQWDKARQAIGRVKSPARRAAVARLLRRTASRFGKSKALKQSWAASNTGPALEFTVDTILPVTSPYDLVISRDPEDGSAVVRHRRGGGEIGRIRHGDDGGWRASRAGQDYQPHARQRGALLELIGVHNRGALTPQHRPTADRVVRGEPLQPPPAQSDLMRRLGIPAIRALATPSNGSGDGPRTTSGANGDSGNSNGLGAKGEAIRKKLIARGFPPDRALAFAKRAENMAAKASS